MLLLFKKRRREIPLRRVRQHCHDCFPFAQLPRQLDRRRHIRAGGNAAHDAFFCRQITGRLDRLFIRHDADVIVDLCVQDGRDQAVADAHLKMGADGSAREDGRMLRLHRPDLHVGILLFEYLADAGDGSAGPDAGTDG